MLHSVENAEPVISLYFKWLPFEVDKHLCDTSWDSCCEIVEEISSPMSLDLFQGFDVPLLVRVPDRLHVLQYRAYCRGYYRWFVFSDIST